MTTIETLKTIDRIAQQANSLWHQCESLKQQLAKQSGISTERLEQNGIYVPVEYKQESNTKSTG